MRNVTKAIPGLKILLAGATFFGLAGTGMCQEPVLVSRVVKNAQGKAYLEVDGKPYLYNSVQSWFPPEADYALYMQKAAEVNYKTFSFWLFWRDIEPKEGKYDWTVLDRMVDLANRHGMRLDVVWGGSLFCGGLDPRFAPGFVMNDPSLHKKDAYGNVVVVKKNDMGPCPVADFSSRALFDKEKKCIQAMMEHLREYDANHRVIFFQVENEPNLMEWGAGQKARILNYIDRLGSVIASSSYRMATRVNLSGPEYDPQIDSLDNIGCHGVDPYRDDVELIRRLSRTRTKMPHIAENAAWENSSSLIVTALANGAFYNIYRLDYDRIWKNPGVYGEDWIYLNETTYDIRFLNAALNKIGRVITATVPADMIEFNTEQSRPASPYHVRKNVNGWLIGFQSRRTIETGESDNAPVGMVAVHDGDFFCLADDMCYFTFDREPVKCESGFFDENDCWQPVQKRDITVQPGPEYRIDYVRGDCLRIRISK